MRRAMPVRLPDSLRPKKSKERKLKMKMLKKHWLPP